MKKIKFRTDSHLQIQTIVDEQIDEFGNKHIMVRWEDTDSDISLGSLNKPNKKIISIRYTDDKPKKIFTSLFD